MINSQENELGEDIEAVIPRKIELSTTGCLRTLIEDKQKLKTLAKATVAESVPGLGLALTTYLLSPKTTLLTNPLVSTSLLLTSNFLLRLPNYESLEKEFENICKTKAPLIGIARTVHSLVFALIILKTGYVLLHETGHALTALALFRHADITVDITPGAITSRGLTLYEANGLTPMGDLLGQHASELCFTLAGTGANLLWDFLSLTFTHLIADEFPEIKSHLRMSAMVGIISSLLYTLSPYTAPCDKFNDFCILEENGIPAYAAFLTILLSTLLLQCTLASVNQCTSENETANEYGPIDIVIEDEAKRETEKTQRMALH